MNEQVLKSIWRRLPKPRTQWTARLLRQQQRAHLAHIRLLAAIAKRNNKPS
jgi:hypothetical protein